MFHLVENFSVRLNHFAEVSLTQFVDFANLDGDDAGNAFLTSNEQANLAEMRSINECSHAIS